MWSLIFLLFFSSLFYLWYKTMKLKEEALVLVKNEAEKYGYQILDEVIRFSNLKIQRKGWGYLFIKSFSFDYIDQKNQRQIGKLIRYGKSWEKVKFHLASEFNKNKKGNLIPFPKKGFYDE